MSVLMSRVRRRLAGLHIAVVCVLVSGELVTADEALSYLN